MFLNIACSEIYFQKRLVQRNIFICEYSLFRGMFLNIACSEVYFLNRAVKRNIFTYWYSLFRGIFSCSSEDSFCEFTWFKSYSFSSISFKFLFVTYLPLPSNKPLFLKKRQIISTDFFEFHRSSLPSQFLLFFPLFGI